MTQTTTPDLTEQTPVQIDTDLAELFRQQAVLEGDAEVCATKWHYALGETQTRVGKERAWPTSHVEAYRQICAADPQRGRTEDGTPGE